MNARDRRRQKARRRARLFEWRLARCWEDLQPALDAWVEAVTSVRGMP